MCRRLKSARTKAKRLIGTTKVVPYSCSSRTEPPARGQVNNCRMRLLLTVYVLGTIFHWGDTLGWCGKWRGSGGQKTKQLTHFHPTHPQLFPPPLSTPPAPFT